MGMIVIKFNIHTLLLVGVIKIGAEAYNKVIKYKEKNRNKFPVSF